MRFLRFILAALMLFSMTVTAQTRPDSWDNLGSLRVGQKIQVLGWDMKAVNGAFASLSSDSISVRKEKESDVVIVPRANIFRILDREHSRRSRNALIGMSIGVGAGVAMGLATKSEYPLAVPLGLFLGSIAAGTGAGAALPSHPVIYQATKKPK